MHPIPFHFVHEWGWGASNYLSRTREFIPFSDMADDIQASAYTAKKEAQTHEAISSSVFVPIGDTALDARAFPQKNMMASDCRREIRLS